tara:strand:+ start:200 stop:652 length:453 start_codon:yes stop_codon:yes gene_type:complete
MPVLRHILFIDGYAFYIKDAKEWLTFKRVAHWDDTSVADIDRCSRIISLLSYAEEFGEEDIDTLVEMPWTKQVMTFGEFIKLVCAPVEFSLDGDTFDMGSIGTFPVHMYEDSIALDDEEAITNEEEVELVIGVHILMELSAEDGDNVASF